MPELPPVPDTYKTAPDGGLTPVAAGNPNNADTWAASRGLIAGKSVIPVGAGAVGLTNDSVAFAAAVVIAKATGFPLVISGYYRIPTMPAILLDQTIPLKIVALPGTTATIDAQGTSGGPASRFATLVGGGGIIVDGDITFANYAEGVLIGSDGVPTVAFGSAWTSDITDIMFRRTQFSGCVRSVYLTHLTAKIGRLRLFDIESNGKNSGGTTVAVGGLIFDVVSMPKVRARNVYVSDIDGTSVGYGGGGIPIRNACSQGFVLGNNSATGTLQDANSDWQISSITVERILDSRNVVSGTSPLVEAIRVVGCRGAAIANLEANDIRAPNALKDCSGFYFKVRGGSIVNISGFNAGQSSEGSLLFKGVTEYGLDPGGGTSTNCRGDAVVCSNVNLRTDFGSKTVGIGIQTSNVRINGIILDGFGDSTTTYAPILTYGARLDNIELSDITLRNCVGSLGARITHNGQGFKMRRITIDGVAGVAGSRTIAVAISSVNDYIGTGNPTTYGMIDFTIDDITVTNLIDQGSGAALIELRCNFGDIRGFALTRLRRAESKLSGSDQPVPIGLYAGGTSTGVISETVLDDNDFTNVTSKMTLTGSVVPAFKSMSRNLPYARTSSATNNNLALLDQTVLRTNATAQTTTIPPNSTVPFPVGHVVDVEQSGAGALTIVAGAGVTINKLAAKSLVLSGQYGRVRCAQTAANIWTVNGDLT